MFRNRVHQWGWVPELLSVCMSPAGNKWLSAPGPIEREAGNAETLNLPTDIWRNLLSRFSWQSKQHLQPIQSFTPTRPKNAVSSVFTMTCGQEAGATMCWVSLRTKEREFHLLFPTQRSLYDSTGCPHFWIYFQKILTCSQFSEIKAISHFNIRWHIPFDNVILQSLLFRSYCKKKQTPVKTYMVQEMQVDGQSGSKRVRSCATGTHISLGSNYDYPKVLSSFQLLCYIFFPKLLRH